jgi:phosphoserine phosphatase RsbU/P
MSFNELPGPSAVSDENGGALPATGGQFATAARRSPIQFDFGHLGKQLVDVTQELPHVAGVRLWRMLGGEPTVLHQSGKLLFLDKAVVEKISQGHSPGPVETSQWIYPLTANAEVVGVLEVSSEELLSDRARSLLEKVVQIAEAGLSLAHEQHALLELSAILEATKLLNSTLDLSQLIRIILKLSTRLCGADRGTVFLVDYKRNEIWSLEGLGLEEQEIRLPIDRGIAGWVACHGHPVRVEDARADSRFDPQVDRDLGYHTRGLLALPVRNKGGEIVGVVELLNKETGSFTIADEHSLSHLSDHVAVALENARLHRESLAKQRMEGDLALARGVQRGLLPERPPTLENFEIGVAYTPSLMVGGDYYDFLRLKPDSLMAVIADVEGKGVASALMMANLRAALHTLVAHVHALEHLAESVNNMIFSDSRAHKLLSMFVAVIEDRQRVLHYINAGHLPPIVIRQDGKVEHLREGGMVMGALHGVPFKRGRIRLDPGDLVAAYTDGITEATDVHGEEYGLERLLDLLRAERAAPASQIVETVLSSVDLYSRGGTHEDDRVILILKVS